MVHKIKAIILKCLLGSRRKKKNQNCHALIKISKSYFNPWMSNSGDVHTIKNIYIYFCDKWCEGGGLWWGRGTHGGGQDNRNGYME